MRQPNKPAFFIVASNVNPSYLFQFSRMYTIQI